MKQPQDQEALYSFYIMSLIRLSRADERIELKEKIKVKAFIQREIVRANQARFWQEYLDGLDSPVDEQAFTVLVQKLKQERVLTPSIRRRFIYSMAQIARSKGGSLDHRDYEEIITIAKHMGVREIDADGIMESVFGITDTFIAIIGTFCIGVAFYFTRALLVPLFLGYFLSRIVNKSEEMLSRLLFKGKRGLLSKVLAMVSIFMLIFILFMVGAQATTNAINQLPQYEKKMAEVIEGVKQHLEAYTGSTITSVMDILPTLEKMPIAEFLGSVFGGLFNVLGFFSTLALVFLFSGYLIFSDFSYHGVFLEMDKKISSYVSVKFLVSFLTGALFYLTGLAFGVDFAFFWGFLAFLLNFIPSVGSIIGTIPPIVLAFLSLPWQVALGAAVLFIAIQTVMGNIVEPMLMGKTMKINAIAVLAGLIFWGFLWGIPGMLMSAPLMALLKLIAENYTFSQKLSKYM